MPLVMFQTTVLWQPSTHKGRVTYSCIYKVSRLNKSYRKWLFYKGNDNCRVLTKARKVREETEWNLVSPVLKRGRNKSLQEAAYHCSFFVPAQA